MTPEQQAFFDALDATWPARGSHTLGPWQIRDGAGGGRRVSSATTPQGDVTEAEIDAAEAFHRSLGQVPLFRIQPGNEALDARLAARGYRLQDPTDLLAGRVAEFAPTRRLRAIPHWPPLALTRDIWQEAEIGPERQAVMARVTGPHIAIIGRDGDGADRAAGCAFAAVQGDIGMVHALVVMDAMRRRGSANNMMCFAAKWAQDHGATWMAVAVTQGNATAQKLYSSLQMGVVGQYHYRSA